MPAESEVGMGLLDSLKERFLPEDKYDYYEDEDFDEPGGRRRDYDRGRDFDQPDEDERPKSGLLGNTSRPEAESVKVTTRSGRRITGDRQPGAYQGDWEDEIESYPGSGTYANTSVVGSAIRPGAAQLPAYVLKPVAYEEVMMVVRRVRTNQPVVVDFTHTNIEVAKRILDFCFGLSYGLEGSVETLAERVFAVLPRGMQLSQADLDKLAASGLISR